MFRKKTTPFNNSLRKRKRNERELHLNVTSPRIVLFQSLKAVKNGAKGLLIWSIILTILFFAYQAIHRHFNDNEEFSIQFIPVTDFDGNDTVVLSKEQVWEISEIDTTGTIFEVDLDDVRQRLSQRPEVIDVKVDRKLPHTIDIKMTERVPVAWLSCRELGLAGRNPYRGVLLDEHGVSFKSSKGFWEVAKNLPVIETSVSSKDAFVLGKKMNHPDAARALQLVMRLKALGPLNWGGDRVVVENFYTLNLVCNDGLIAKCSMYDHDFQLKKLALLREHASNNGRSIQWIDLRPKTNNPGEYVGGGGVVSNMRGSGRNTISAEEETTNSILDRD